MNTNFTNLSDWDSNRSVDSDYTGYIAEFSALLLYYCIEVAVAVVERADDENFIYKTKITGGWWVGGCGRA